MKNKIKSILIALFILFPAIILSSCMVEYPDIYNYPQNINKLITPASQQPAPASQQPAPITTSQPPPIVVKPTIQQINGCKDKPTPMPLHSGMSEPIHFNCSPQQFNNTKDENQDKKAHLNIDTLIKFTNHISKSIENLFVSKTHKESENKKQSPEKGYYSIEVLYNWLAQFFGENIFTKSIIIFSIYTIPLFFIPSLAIFIVNNTAASNKKTRHRGFYFGLYTLKLTLTFYPFMSITYLYMALMTFGVTNNQLYMYSIFLWIITLLAWGRNIVGVHYIRQIPSLYPHFLHSVEKDLENKLLPSRRKIYKSITHLINDDRKNINDTLYLGDDRGSGKSFFIDILIKKNDSIGFNAPCIIPIDIWSEQSEPDLQFALLDKVLSHPAIIIDNFRNYPLSVLLNHISRFFGRFKAKIKMPAFHLEANFSDKGVELFWQKVLERVTSRKRMVYIFDELDRASTPSTQNALSLTQRSLNKFNNIVIIIGTREQINTKAFNPLQTLYNPDLTDSVHATLFDLFTKEYSDLDKSSQATWPNWIRETINDYTYQHSILENLNNGQTAPNSENNTSSSEPSTNSANPSITPQHRQSGYHNFTLRYFLTKYEKNPNFIRKLYEQSGERYFSNEIDFDNLYPNDVIFLADTEIPDFNKLLELTYNAKNPGLEYDVYHEKCLEILTNSVGILFVSDIISDQGIKSLTPRILLGQLRKTFLNARNTFGENIDLSDISVAIQISILNSVTFV
ncbi:MAG: hypothetical protein HQL54_08285 [Magnetococcales bacterium]|nr:hypothetical protein [Magnetococcales bacterium]